MKALVLVLALALSSAPLQAAEWQTEAYTISTDEEAVYPVASILPPKGWTPQPDKTLNESLPFPWPKQYVEQYNQPFNPWTFFRNAAALCTHYNETKSADTKAIMVQLVDRLVEFSTVEDGQRFLLYTFEKGYRGEYDVEVPWTSAYASGAALIGLSLMDDCAEIDGAREMADEVLAGLANPIDPREDRPRYWVSFLDERGYLWFEEKPLDQVEQPRILNGHIRAITGLYIYWSRTKSEKALELLRAGIKTVEEYAPEYRKPDGINAYDMMEPYVADYGPERTIGQQDILYKMTGDPIFAIYRDVFEADMRDEIAAAD